MAKFSNYKARQERIRISEETRAFNKAKAEKEFLAKSFGNYSENAEESSGFISPSSEEYLTGGVIQEDRHFDDGSFSPVTQEVRFNTLGKVAMRNLPN